MADWATISSLATAGGTLVLAVATFAAVRSSNQSARIAELALQEQRRPLLVQSRADVADAVRRREPMAVELLYSDQVGGQRTISRFSLIPFAREEDDDVNWIVSGTRHWFLDRAGPR